MANTEAKWNRPERNGLFETDEPKGVVGDQLDLYKCLAEGPSDVETLARRTETDPRYLREWLSAQAASGYVEYDAVSQRFILSDEQAFALAEEGSPDHGAGVPGVALRRLRLPPALDRLRPLCGQGGRRR